MPAPDWNAMPEAEFRQVLRQFIDAECPAELRNYPHRFPASVTMPWYRALHRRDFIAPGWPPEYGGMGLSPDRHLIFIEEMESAGTPWLHDAGVRNLGPAIIAWGTEAQKAHYLPKMHAGEHIWCQGYSEPAAGSDLASLQCDGRIDGDRMVINGQKIWTTSAHVANHIFALIRTDRAGAKQDGISFVLIDMTLPGIIVRPIENLSGHPDFCEVFFDNVTVGTECILGQPNKGWAVARSLLGFERIWAGSPKRALKVLIALRRKLEERGLLSDPLWRDRLAQAEFDTQDAQDMYAGFADLVRTDGKVGVEGLAAGFTADPFPGLFLAGRALALAGADAETIGGLAAGTLPAALAWQEGPADFAAPRPRTVLDGGRLSGAKGWIVGAAEGAPFLVSARSTGETVLAWVEPGAPGLSLSQGFRADGSPMDRLDLNGTPARVLASGSLADAALRRALDETSVLIAAELMGHVDRMMVLVLEHLKTRRQFGRPIGAFQALQHRAADMFVRQRLARAVLDAGLARIDGITDAAAFGMQAARLRARLNDTALWIMRESIQLFGAMGITDENDLSLHVKRCLALTGWLGNSTEQRRYFMDLAMPGGQPAEGRI